MTDRGTRLPEDWIPYPELLTWAQMERDDIDVAMEVEKFRDYWLSKPGKDGRKLRWDLTWKNWIRSARPSPRKPQGHSMSKTASAYFAIGEALERTASVVSHQDRTRAAKPDSPVTGVHTLNGPVASRNPDMDRGPVGGALMGPRTRQHPNRRGLAEGPQRLFPMADSSTVPGPTAGDQGRTIPTAETGVAQETQERVAGSEGALRVQRHDVGPRRP